LKVRNNTYVENACGVLADPIVEPPMGNLSYPAGVPLSGDHLKKPKAKPSGNEKPHKTGKGGKLKGGKKESHQKLRPGHNEKKKQKPEWKPFGK
jgi:hypothetical protein